MSSTILVLLAAKDMLQEEGWTKGTFARDASGKPVPVMSERADSFDVSGAIVRAVGGITKVSQAADTAYREGLGESLPSWQDHASFKEVLDWFDETIEMLRLQRGDFVE